jgi:hypothetical protein
VDAHVRNNNLVITSLVFLIIKYKINATFPTPNQDLDSSCNRLIFYSSNLVAAVFSAPPPPLSGPMSVPSFLLKHLTMQPLILDNGIPPRQEGTEMPRKSASHSYTGLKIKRSIENCPKNVSTFVWPFTRWRV